MREAFAQCRFWTLPAYEFGLLEVLHEVRYPEAPGLELTCKVDFFKYTFNTMMRLPECSLGDFFIYNGSVALKSSDPATSSAPCTAACHLSQEVRR